MTGKSEGVFQIIIFVTCPDTKYRGFIVISSFNENGELLVEY